MTHFFSEISIRKQINNKKNFKNIHLLNLIKKYKPFLKCAHRNIIFLF